MLGPAVSAEAIKVRIQTVDKNVHIGTLTERSDGSVVFCPNAGTPIRLTDAQIGLIQFPVNDDQEQQIDRLTAEGNYFQLEAVLRELLSPYLPYVELPSNVTDKFLKWMAASFWVGDYERVQTLSVALERFGSRNQMSLQSRFYRELSRLEKGDFEAMKAFLATPQAAEVFPPESPARLYIDARMFQHEKNYTQAIRSVSRLMALYSRNGDWMPQAELLCAELYIQLKMPESAREVLADIREFYSNPKVQEKAAAIAAGQ
jgi:hypothetical protein